MKLNRVYRVGIVSISIRSFKVSAIVCSFNNMSNAIVADTVDIDENSEQEYQ